MFLISTRFKPYLSQFFAVITATLLVLSSGIQLTWTSPAVPILQRTFEETVGPDEVYWLQSLYIFGGITGLSVTFIVVNVLGRRRSILLAGCIDAVCWVLIAFADSIVMLYAVRFCSGIAANIGYITIPMYTAEVSQPHIRGFLGTLTYTMSLVGALVAYVIIPYMPIYGSAICGACISLSMISSFYWQPESPYYLLLKKDTSGARDALKRLRYDKDVEEELKSISAAVERQNSEKGRLIDLFIVPSNRKALIIMFFLNFAQNFVGISIIQMNIQTIFETSGTVISSEIAAILFGVAMLVSVFFGSVLIDRYGRKVLLISSSILSAIFLSVFSWYFIMKEVGNADMEPYNWVPIFAAIGYALAFKYGLGIVPIVATGELFPTSVKTMGMCLSDLCFTGMAAASIKVYHYSLITYGMYFPLLIFLGCAIFMAVFVFFYVPETKGLSLEEIQIMLKDQTERK